MVPKKRFQYSVDLCSAETILDIRAIQGQSRGKQIDRTLPDNVLIPSDFAEYIYHVGSSHDLHSVIQSGLIPGRKVVKKGRHAVFFTAVNPMFVHQHKQRKYDIAKPRIAMDKQNWEIHQNTAYWANMMVAQRKGLTFYQTRSNAIIFHSTSFAVCVEKVVAMHSGEELFNKLYEYLRLPHRIVLKPALYYGRQDTTSIDENIQRPL